MSQRKFQDLPPDQIAAGFATDTEKVDPNRSVPLRDVGEERIPTPLPPSEPAMGSTPGQIPQASLENIMLMLVDALRGVASGQANAQQVAAAALESAARQQQPDNKFAPLISVFNPQGDLQYPKPDLKCKMYLPWEAEKESLTWEEIELLNLLQAGEYTVKRNDGTKIMITVKIVRNLNGRPERLLMNSETGFNDDNHWLMPPLTTTLRNILDQNPETKQLAREILTMDERYDLVLEGKLPVSVGQR